MVQRGKSSPGVGLTGDERLHASEPCVLQVDKSGPVRSKISLIERAERVAEKVVGFGIHRIACPGNTICRLASTPEVDSRLAAGLRCPDGLLKGQVQVLRHRRDSEAGASQY